MTAPTGPAWAIWVDTGGTFTDCVARGPGGAYRRVKVLSSGRIRGRIDERLDAGELRVDLPWSLPDGFFVGCAFRVLGGAEGTVRAFRGRERLLRTEPGVAAGAERGAAFEIASPEEAPLLAARIATRTPFGRPLPPVELRLATTRGTNALLERRGAETALFITRGFADLLVIGNQQRPELFRLDVVKPAPLHAAVVEVDERLDAAGRVVKPLDLEGLEAEVRRLIDGGIEAAAVALLHGYRNPAHEEELAGFLRRVGIRHVSTSASLAARIRFVPRAETAVVNAYLSPVVGDYLARVGEGLGGAEYFAMTSAGGLVGARRYRPKDSLLSGPAGGVVGAAWAGARSGLERLIAFDMGGTSTDVSRYDGGLDYRFETRVGDARLLAPGLAIETVAAGGGSICGFDGRQLKVGPESAGAQPGPACYGAGGPLTLTDVNLLLGRLDRSRFEIPIDRPAAERRAEEVLAAARAAGAEISRGRVLEGFLRIADERMAEAVRRISIRHGYRAADFALVAFGGAGGQHACSLADLLKIDRVLVPSDAGLLSAWGLGRARVERFAERQVLAPLEQVEGELDRLVEELVTEARRAVAAEGVPFGETEARLRRANLRLLGQDSTLPIELREGADLRREFAAAFGDHYGFRPPDRPIEVESVEVAAAAAGEELEPAAIATAAASGPPVIRRAVFGGRERDTPCRERASLAIGEELRGPALVFEPHSATVIGPGWMGRVDAAGGLLLERREGEA